MKTELLVMLSLQDKMNTKVHPQWREQNFAFFRAAWIETAELIDHFGYKWWKKQTPDMAQVQLEVVDIWHFGLSMLLTDDAPEAIADKIIEDLKSPVKNQGVIDASEDLAESLLATRKFNVPVFWSLMNASELTFDDLFKQYVGKNVLNFFRQDNGYKTGEYKKQWHGREDNEHLSDILASIEEADETIADTIYSKLSSVYASL
ncbi:MAG: dUTP diphosphatase [Cellvibrionales bacterium]|nr:dUTP diphosphatase [Cellvibrionales bacterium]